MRARGRKLLALLAGGVVLAGGGVTTLASWQDNEFAKLPLSLSSFNVQSSLDGSNWTDAETQPDARSLVVAVAGGLNRPLVPNGAVTAWIALRAAPKSLGALVTMTTVSVGDLGSDSKGLLTASNSSGSPALTYEAVTGVQKTDCEANQTGGGTALVSPGSTLGPVSTSTSAFTLDPGIGDAAGPAVGVCFRLKLADSLSHAYAGAKVTPIWSFNATSRDS